MNHRLFMFLTAGGVLVFDRLTKWLIEARMSVWDTHVVIPHFFNIVHTKNRGIAFGLMNDSAETSHTLALVLVSVTVLVFIVYMMWRLTKDASPLLRFGFALVLGGALGNLWDRLLAGSVTDFLEFYVGTFVWPAFNVADSAICVGAGLLILDMLRNRRQEARA